MTVTMFYVLMVSLSIRVVCPIYTA